MYTYQPLNRPAQESAPKGYKVIEAPSENRDFGVIGYEERLSPIDQWGYELANLEDDYSVGDLVSYVLKGKVYTGIITSMEDNLRIYVDDYECLPYWKLTHQS